MTATRGLLLGVDGGNTKTLALVATADGTVLGAGRAMGCADIHAAAPEAALAVVATAVEAAFAEAAASTAVARDVDSARALAGAAFSMAGADWPEDMALLEAELGERWPGATVVNDAIGALRGAIPSGPGVVVVAGTGATTGARGADGRTWHSSFWQEPQGAHELGVHALHAVYRAELGIDPPTALRARILEALGATDVEEVLHRQSMRGPGRWRGARTLAPLLLDAAEEGDPAAISIVSGQGRALGRMAVAAAHRVGIGGEPFALALAGGLFRHDGDRLRVALLDAVRMEAPAAREVAPRLEPVAGALLLAFDAAGIPADERVQARVRATLPGAELFDTRAPEGSGAIPA